MSDNFALLDIPISPLREGFVLPVGDKPQNFYSLKVDDVFNPGIIDFFVGIGFIPQHALIFHHRPLVDSQAIHIDTAGDKFRCSINWIYGSHLMRWYVPSPGTNLMPGYVSPMHGENSAKNVPFVILPVANAIEIDRTTDTGPLLVNTGSIYHNAINTGDTDRWAVSIKFTTESTPSWEHCIRALSSYIINDRSNHEKSN